MIILILLIYLLLYIYKYGIPEHISETYYKFGIFFTLTFWIVGITLFINLINKYEEISSIIFLMIGAFLMIGTSPLLEDEIEGLIHRICSFFAMVISVLYMCLINPFLLLSFLSCIFIKKSTWLFWIEVSCLTGVWISSII